MVTTKNCTTMKQFPSLCVVLVNACKTYIPLKMFFSTLTLVHLLPRSLHTPCSAPTAPLPRFGFVCILLQILRLKPGGLLIGGPPCGTWVFINRGTSKRSKRRVLGDSTKPSVVDSNTLLDQTQPL